LLHALPSPPTVKLQNRMHTTSKSTEHTYITVCYARPLGRISQCMQQ